MSRKKKKIAILGCGWVGNTLKEKLEKEGHEVNCLCRDISMDTLVGFYACDVLVLAIPPSKDSLETIENALFSLRLNETIETQVILLSSISFYTHKKEIVETENLVKNAEPESVVLRLGGLMGYDRVAGKYTAGKSVKDAPTHYVHRDDVVGIIETIIGQGIKSKIFNVVAPVQSTKKEIYTQNSKQFGFEETHFEGAVSEPKSYSSDILCDTLGYNFKKEDVRDFWK